MNANSRLVTLLIGCLTILALANWALMSLGDGFAEYFSEILGSADKLPALTKWTRNLVASPVASIAVIITPVVILGLLLFCRTKPVVQWIAIAWVLFNIPAVILGWMSFCLPFLHIVQGIGNQTALAW